MGSQNTDSLRRLRRFAECPASPRTASANHVPCSSRVAEVQTPAEATSSDGFACGSLRSRQARIGKGHLSNEHTAEVETVSVAMTPHSPDIQERTNGRISEGELAPPVTVWAANGHVRKLENHPGAAAGNRRVSHPTSTGSGSGRARGDG